MKKINNESGSKVAQAIDNRIINIAKEVFNNSPNNKTKLGKVLSKRFGLFDIEIEKSVYKKVPALRNVGDINVGEIAVCLVPNNQFSNMIILGVADGTIKAASSGSDVNINVVDNLTSTSTSEALSANQGRILNETKASVVALNSLQSVVEGNSTNITNLLNNKADQTAVNGLSTRMTSAENNIANLEDDKADRSEIPTKVSDLENDSKFISSIPAEYVTESELTAKGYDTVTSVNSKISNNLSQAKSYTDTKVSALVDSAPETLDTLSELATAIQNNETVVDALDSAISNKADKSEIPTALSQLSTDSTHRVVTDSEKATWNSKLSSYTETDPTVPSWAKQPTKPQYEYNEILNTPIIPDGSKLYDSVGTNTDGAMTQSAATKELNSKLSTAIISSKPDTIDTQRIYIAPRYYADVVAGGQYEKYLATGTGNDVLEGTGVLSSLIYDTNTNTAQVFTKNISTYKNPIIKLSFYHSTDFVDWTTDVLISKSMLPYTLGNYDDDPIEFIIDDISDDGIMTYHYSSVWYNSWFTDVEAVAIYDGVYERLADVADLSKKADKSLMNLSTSELKNWKRRLNSAGMPSGSYETLTPTNNGTYTASADGWYAWVATTTSSSFANITLKNQTTGVWFRQAETATSAGMYGLFPVRKGDTIALTYGNVSFSGDSNKFFRFYLSEGQA